MHVRRSVRGAPRGRLTGSGPEAAHRLGFAVKRTADVVLAALGLVLLAPALLAIAAAIRLDSRGPVLFRQGRLGRQGRRFEMLKFRTMAAGAPMAFNADGSTHVGARDTRVTRVGRLLRGGLDELPQLVNVLRGEMSLVGPRPDLPEHEALYSDEERRKLQVRPGMTSLAAVLGRNALDWRRRMALDLRWMDRWSLGLDLRVALQTLALPFRVRLFRFAEVVDADAGPLPTEGAADASDVQPFLVDTAVVAVTQALLKLRGLVTLPLIVKLLGTAEYGTWIQVLAFSGLLASLLSGNVHLPLVRSMAADPALRAVTWSSILSLSVAAGGLGVIAVIGLSERATAFLLGGGAPTAYVVLAAVLALLGNVRQINLNVYRALGRLRLRSVLELVTTGGQLCGIYLLLQAGGTLLQVLVFMAAWEATIAVGQTLHVAASVGVARIRWRVVGDTVRYALPLVPAAFSAWAMDRADRLIIGHYRGLEAVGVYSANYALAALLLSVQFPLQMTLLPKVAALWRDDRERAAAYIGASIRFFVTVGVPFTVALLVLAAPLLHLLGDAHIAASAGLTTCVIAAGVSCWGLTLIQNQVFHGAGRPHVIGAAWAAAAAVNVALNILLVPRLGIRGAALATLLTYAALCLSCVAMTRRIVSIDYHPAHAMRCLAASVPMLGVLMWLAPRDPTWIAVAVAAGGAVYVAALLAFGGLSGPERDAVYRVLFRRPARD